MLISLLCRLRALRAKTRLAAASGLLAIVGLGLSVASVADDTPGAKGNKVHYPTVEGAAQKRAGGGPGATSGGFATSLNLVSPGSLYYRGGVAGVGVTTGAPKVYLVFWGSQWGTAGTDANGNVTLSGDTKQAMPVLQQFFRGLGTGGETWSGVMTQSCETVVNATTCPASARHVGYPTGGALAGVWYDNAAAMPGTTNDNAIAQEALAAARKFGNLTPESNRNVQYVVLSPPGTHPGGFSASAGWCAWHDWNGDTTLTGGAVVSNVGNFAFTNMPYVSDLGASCGANYVNAGTAGLIDGFTLVGGHEYAETITDQFPAGGWTDATGYENSDKCSWIGTGGTGGSINLTLPTGTFPVQGHWSNDTNGCANSHAIVADVNPNFITASPTGTMTVPTAVAIKPVTLSATGSNAGISQYTFSVKGLPAGLTLNAGVISGTPTVRGTFTSWTTAADPAGAVGYTPITWVTGSTITVAKPANQTTTKGVAAAQFIASATNSNPAYSAFTWSATALPAGISINASTGLISGTPTTVKSATTVTLKATDTTGASGSNTFSWTVVTTTVAVSAIAQQSNPRGTAVAAVKPTAIDNNPALTTFTWSATGLPTGLVINTATGVIGGTISATATKKTYSVVVTAKDANLASGTAKFSWVVT